MIGPLQQYVSVLQQPTDMTDHFFVLSQTGAPIWIASFHGNSNWIASRCWRTRTRNAVLCLDKKHMLPNGWRTTATKHFTGWCATSTVHFTTNWKHSLEIPSPTAGYGASQTPIMPASTTTDPQVAAYTRSRRIQHVFSSNESGKNARKSLACADFWSARCFARGVSIRNERSFNGLKHCTHLARNSWSIKEV